MKNYFSFHLTGKKLLPIWILFLIFFIAPYFVLIFRMQNIEPGSKAFLFVFPLLILLVIIAFGLTFFMAKLTIENVSFKNQSIVYHGTFGKYIGTILLGFFLSIVTLGVYSPWFIRDIHRFFVNNSFYNSQSLKFRGKGIKLFLILLLSVILPTVILSVLMARSMIDGNNQTPTFVIIQQVVTMIIMIPYMYFVYKWMIDIDYKDLHISWDTDFWNSCGKIAVEMVLSIITVGIYMPLAMLRLYKYFAEKTKATSHNRKLSFGYEIDQLNDFLFIWGQVLLTIITAGIYYPWAFCKIGNRILGKTYLMEG